MIWSDGMTCPESSCDDCHVHVTRGQLQGRRIAGGQVHARVSGSVSGWRNDKERKTGFSSQSACSLAGAPGQRVKFGSSSDGRARFAQQTMGVADCLGTTRWSAWISPNSGPMRRHVSQYLIDPALGVARRRYCRARRKWRLGSHRARTGFGAGHAGTVTMVEALGRSGWPKGQPSLSQDPIAGRLLSGRGPH